MINRSAFLLNFSILLSLLWSAPALSQQYLYLQKGNDVPHKRIGLNDRVQFKTQDSDLWVKGMVTAINTESITIGRVTYPLNVITTFRTKNSLAYTVGSAGVFGGAMFAGIFLVNGLINKSSPVITEQQMLVSGSLVATGFAIRLLGRKTYKVENGWKWKVIDLEKNTEP